jgi:hypothetical protein
LISEDDILRKEGFLLKFEIINSLIEVLLDEEKDEDEVFNR